jgi:hypothetical protein
MIVIDRDTTRGPDRCFIHPLPAPFASPHRFVARRAQAWNRLLKFRAEIE